MSVGNNINDITRGCTDNANLLSDLRREHDDLETELRKIDSSLRRIGANIKYNQKSTADQLDEGIDCPFASKQKSKLSSIQTSVPPGHQSPISTEYYGDTSHRSRTKRMNHDKSSDSDCTSSNDDDSCDTRRRPKPSNNHHIKPAILSSVVTLPVCQQDVSQQRIEAIEVQKNDKKGLARNKRMFGMILGTLERFQSEESHRLETVSRHEYIRYLVLFLSISSVR